MKRNTQPPEKRVSGDGTVIAVNSIFHTIQGEGPFAGTPAVFVRLAGCNLQCPLCDTEYTNRLDMHPDEIVDEVRGATPQWHEETEFGAAPCIAPTSLVVITGGEPFRQPIGMMAKRLMDAGYRVQVETNGTMYQPNFPWWNKKLTVVCSPKTGSVHRELLPSIAAFKYVGTAASLDPDDGLPRTALEHTAHPRLYRPPPEWTGEIYLQPVDEQDIFANAANRDAVVQSCLKHGYRLCLQIHKDIGVP